jgi:rod shape determining protein RodA
MKDTEQPVYYLARDIFRFLHLDVVLFLLLLVLISVGLVILYSAGGESQVLLSNQGIRLTLAMAGMLVIAQIPPAVLRRWSPWLYLMGLALLLAVLVAGEMGKGAQRWLDLGVIRFQPSEMMKLVVPMMVAWYFADRPLPPRLLELLVSGLLVIVPMYMIAKQPDLGTALLVGSAGGFAIFFAGIRWRVLIGMGVSGVALAPVLWHFMHDYQRQRVLTLFSPESDPLGSGYHIIQSKIAIGSGGVYGKGWLNGTQSQLDFLPERSTDFIFAVFGEEFGLLGAILLILLYLAIIFRGLYIAVYAQDTYSRLLAGSLSLTFFVYLFVNTGMVIGLLPVVGVPLPLVSYGGTSLVTLMAAFGMLMSIQSHRRLLVH